MSADGTEANTIGRLTRKGVDATSVDADALLAKALQQPETQLVLVAPEHLAVTAVGEVDAFGATERLRVWLGQDARGLEWVASSGWAGTEAGPDWRPVREAMAEASEDLQAVLLQALALTRWHADHPFSPADGSPMTPVQGGWVRRDGAGTLHFPRTDPAVITLVEHPDGGRVLLANNASWPEDVYSLVAGFVDPGESAEAAAAREIDEEVGLTISSLRYVNSQPWPFPRSLMLGFRATAASHAEPEVDGAEIRRAAWFTAQQLRDGAVTLPPHGSIARALIEAWLAEQQA